MQVLYAWTNDLLAGVCVKLLYTCCSLQVHRYGWCFHVLFAAGFIGFSNCMYVYAVKSPGLAEFTWLMTWCFAGMARDSCRVFLVLVALLAAVFCLIAGWMIWQGNMVYCEQGTWLQLPWAYSCGDVAACLARQWGVAASIRLMWLCWFVAVGYRFPSCSLHSTSYQQVFPWFCCVVCCKITWSCKLQTCVHWWTELAAEFIWLMAWCPAGMAYGSRRLHNFMPFTPHPCCNFGTRLGFGCIVNGHMNPFTIVVQMNMVCALIKDEVMHYSWLWFCRFTHEHEWELAFEVTMGAHMDFSGESRQDNMGLGPSLVN